MQNIKKITKKSFRVLKITVFIGTNAFLISNLTALIIVSLMKLDYYIVEKIKTIKTQKNLENKEFLFPSAPEVLGADSPQ